MIRRRTNDRGAPQATDNGPSLMRAVMPVALPEVLALRQKTGADRWDEMWDGELHMAAAPRRDHQDYEWILETFLRRFWAPLSGGRVYHQINVAAPGGWPNDFRIPDLVLLLPDRFPIDRNEYFEGGPDVAVEIHSPGDEAYEKLDFYFAVGVREVWIIDRDTLEVEIFLPRKRGRKTVEPGADGWLTSRVAGVQFRTRSEKLHLRIVGDDATLTTLP
jgi:Uma2 family endonuclease